MWQELHLETRSSWISICDRHRWDEGKDNAVNPDRMMVGCLCRHIQLAVWGNVCSGWGFHCPQESGSQGKEYVGILPCCCISRLLAANSAYCLKKNSGCCHSCFGGFLIELRYVIHRGIWETGPASLLLGVRHNNHIRPLFKDNGYLIASRPKRSCWFFYIWSAKPLWIPQGISLIGTLLLVS